MAELQYKYAYEFTVEGMTCASCVGRIEKILKKIEGIETAQANLATNKVKIESTTPLIPNEISHKLTKAGYPSQYIEPIKTKHYNLDVSEMTCASCVGRVDRILNKIEGISDTNVNLATSCATFTADETIDIDLVINKLTKAGYPSQLSVQDSKQTSSKKNSTHDDVNQILKDFIIALIFTLPIFILEMGSHVIPSIHHWVMHNLGQMNNWYIQFVLATLVLLVAGKRFYSKGIPALMRGAPDMNSLVAIGTLAAYSYSCVATFLPKLMPAQTHAVYYESAVVIITLILLGRYLEAKAKSKTSLAIEHLIQLQPAKAHLKTSNGIEEVSTSKLQCNDIVTIKPGESIPSDGVVIEGNSYIDESMMTGEPLPIAKTLGDRVIGGTINQSGSLTVKITAVGSQSVLSQIIRLVEDAQGSKLPIQTLVDKITLWFVPLILAIATLTFIAWYFFGPEPSINLAIINAVAVLIIACPCAMGLATPVSIMVATGRAAELGVLFKNAESLQTLKDIQMVAFDKTGTLTEGKPILTDFICLDENEKNTLLQLAISVESMSEHPIATALINQAQKSNIELLPILDFKAHSGLGVEGKSENHAIFIGAAKYINQQLGYSINGFNKHASELIEQSKSPLYLVVDEQVKAVFAVADEIKPTSYNAINTLKANGIKVAMISGDQMTTAQHIAKRLNIDEVIADVLPDQKVRALEQLKQRYGKVAFVGDGINDAPALAHADVGVAIGTGTNVAIESADLILMSGQLTGVSKALNISKTTIANIRQNLFWAFAYNFALIPLAMGLLYPKFGILLSPMFAAAAMAMSSVFVITNALRLRHIKL